MFVITALLAVLVYFFYVFISTKLTDDLRNESQNRSSILAGTIKGDILRHVIVPRILDRDERIAESLLKPDYSLNKELERIAAELENPDIYTVSPNLTIRNSSNRKRVGETFTQKIIWESATESGSSDFYNKDTKQYYSARPILNPKNGIALGILVIQIDFSRYQNTWRKFGFDMIMTSATGDVIVAAKDNYTGSNIQSILNISPEADLTVERFGKIYNIDENENFVFASELGINGWKLFLLNPAAETQQIIRSYVALLVLTAASIILFTLYLFSRRAARSSTRFRRESEELRALNARLITEVEQRRKAEQSLQSAEQSLEQSSKLAVIGQMSAAVGHELNQPLAAMRTYLAGVRTLLKRARFLEAGQNLNRIDDLIDRMGSITRQMRSFARAHENQITNFDLREALLNAFELMSPQLGMMKVNIKRNIPDHPVFANGDMVRVEQILINLLRNALEATQGEDTPSLSISLHKQDQRAIIIIADNGHGFSDVDKLFEPFFTTKPPGEGLGLGLAISASYAKDMGGNLLARNNDPKGAVFELNLELATAK